MLKCMELHGQLLMRQDMALISVRFASYCSGGTRVRHYTYSSEWAYTVIGNGLSMGSYEWSLDERRDFIAVWRMGGEL